MAARMMDSNWLQTGIQDGLKALVGAVFIWMGGVFWSNWRKATKDEVADLRRELSDQKAKLNGFELAQMRIETKLDNKLETIFSMLKQIEHQLERMQSSE
jgi:hypothetical protein